MEAPHQVHRDHPGVSNLYGKLFNTNLQRERVLRLEVYTGQGCLLPANPKQQDKLNFDEMLLIIVKMFKMVKVIQNVILICNICIPSLVHALLSGPIYEQNVKYLIKKRGLDIFSKNPYNSKNFGF